MNAQPSKKNPDAGVPLPFWLSGFARIRKAALTFTATAGVAVAAVALSYWYKQDALEVEARAQRARNDAHSRLTYAETEKEEIRRFQPAFLELRRKGLAGKERRLDWVESIRQIQEQRRLLPLTYQIDPQQPYRLEQPLPTGDYQLRGSRMKLHMDLLHEMDLFNFLADLRQRGYFAVQDCSLRRTATATPGVQSPALSGDCTLNWLTLTPQPAAPSVPLPGGGKRPALAVLGSAATPAGSAP
ncbi:hypothetical protein MJ904_18505 [Massilia sp. MB5]|uniref:hypothetical protein n=1 Tax=Massilia sp. MB5 TaxID=2919578 RepID=UPI001F0E0A87|nr:hypothetical protein [Massilia sp. MB5]UMR29076.1 hypothetical protein MJ904_18505 [Massilia sp. MB5]